MSRDPIIKECNKIDRKEKTIADEEILIRLLSSPCYYNEDLDIVNPDAFDLRVLKSGDFESFVSLARVIGFDSQDALNRYLSELGYKIWDDKKCSEDHYYGYGKFNCGDAKEVHDMIEINPLKGINKSHVGLFYKHPGGGYYNGPLPKDDTGILEVLSDLADLLTVTKAPVRLLDIR